ncbi:MAG TPA: VOC family protein [Panacibacter sp.]|nr:VOC family protein [Panacibacter sp.]HNP47068.1 VOC family protein [Panacibacter sp.]
MNTATPAIIPMLAYEDGLAAMDWLCSAFGFSAAARIIDDDGKLAHGELTLGSGKIMIASPGPDYQSPKHHRKVCDVTDKWYQVPYIINGCLVYVEDIRKHYLTAKAYGAVILSEIEEGGPGMRYRAEDPEGHRWMFIERC